MDFIVNIDESMFVGNYSFGVDYLAFNFNFIDQVVNDNLPLRKRGRPIGKRRVPLSLDQRRARNAQYERERRNETTEAMAQLAEAAGCEPNVSNSGLLLTVIDRLKKAAQVKPEDDIDNLKRINDNLMSQIETLEMQLNNDCMEYYHTQNNNLIHQTKLTSSPELQATKPFCQSEEVIKNPKKKIKIKFDDDTPLDVPSKWTPKVVKPHVDPDLQTQSQQTVQIELQDQFNSHTDKSYTRSDSDLYTSLAIPRIKTERSDVVDETKSQPEPSIKFVQENLKSDRTSNYLCYKEPTTTNQISQDVSECRVSKKISSKRIQKQIQKGLEEELRNKNAKSPVLDLLSDNEKVLFGDIEWLT